MTYDGTRTIQDPDLVDTFDLDDGRTAYLLYDQGCESPRGNAGNVTTIVQMSDRYLQVDPSGDMADAINHWAQRGDPDMDDLIERFGRIFCDVAAFTRWSGQAAQSDESWGYAWITRADVDRDLSPDADLDAALDAELGEYLDWAAGECYGVIVTDADGEEIDSCWGFIGTDYAEKVARSGLDAY